MGRHACLRTTDLWDWCATSATEKRRFVAYPLALPRRQGEKPIKTSDKLRSEADKELAAKRFDEAVAKYRELLQSEKDPDLYYNMALALDYLSRRWFA